jgi:hypothetical protein
MDAVAAAIGQQPAGAGWRSWRWLAGRSASSEQA